jgi:hypothetical protein
MIVSYLFFFFVIVVISFGIAWSMKERYHQRCLSVNPLVRVDV